MSDAKKNKQLTVKGRLVLKTFARTTKSESLGVYLETEDGSFLIRPAGGNPFTDNPLAKLAGKFIEATGRRSDYVFFASSWREIPEPEA
ncbi:hypothetical protein ACFOTA_23835 [Chitinophaga sp. GCM10012297]|uniref:Uncharacterized protein n=1 Tax=Chitinophaga chungangae TaxID=2821488 RepID=A0ABS3YKP8_9BACT|nr:hypothetical protein [Chitinophaga chungangae]MBO9155262.1 hypothetical protein [Chitinophaga chungangae]